MINLIPPHGQTALKHEYVLRVGSIYGFIFAGIFAASAALMIPTYVLTSSQLNAARANNKEMEKTKMAFTEAAHEIKIANAVMSELRPVEEPFTYSEIIEEIVRRSPQGVRLTFFQGEHESGKLTKVIIKGVASGRNTLSDFKDSLEASAFFETATVPIADLIRDADLPFVITLTMSLPPISP